jgi:hypothetical protein
MKNNRLKILIFILSGLFLMSCGCGFDFNNLLGNGASFFDNYADNINGYQQEPNANNAFNPQDSAESVQTLGQNNSATNEPYINADPNPVEKYFDGVDTSNYIVSYTLKNQTLSDPHYYDLMNEQYRSQQTDVVLHQSLWRIATYVFPETYRKKITQVIFYSDGRDNELAMVEPVNDTVNNSWILYIDILDASNTKEYSHTLVHELGHVMTLNTDQINSNYSSCNTFENDIGCFTQSSYMAAFVDQFWMDILPEWQDIEYNTTDEDAFYAQIEDFYYQYSDQFVSEYAPTSPEEDFCESWMYYVFEMTPQGAETARQKIQYFTDYPELVLLARQIRANLK